MSEIIFPTREELNQASKVDIRSELLGSNPFLRNSILGAFAKMLAFRMFDLYEKEKELLTQTFWDTSETPYLNRWSSIFGITTNAATGAAGNVVAQGTPGSVIPNNSKLGTGGIQYKTTLSETIQAQSLGITSLTLSGNVVTAVTASNHNLATGIDATIAGAVETEYNGVWTIIVTGANTFTYLIETSPSTPATGTITVSFNTALVPVQADDSPVLFTGFDTNQDSGASLSFTVPIPGVNNATFVDFNGLTGGADQESSEDQRIRFLFRVQNPVANFNVSAITLKALEVPGNTRIFVNEITPAVGQVTVYFTRDNDGIIPTAGDVTATKDKILEIKPANTDDSDVIVKAPTAKPIDFDFTAAGGGFINPDTSTMRQAINDNLDVFFEEKTEVGRDLLEPEYISAIQNTIDLETGEKLINFQIGSGGPSGTISVGDAEIPTKGTVNF